MPEPPSGEPRAAFCQSHLRASSAAWRAAGALAALQMRCKNIYTLLLLQGYSLVGHCRDILRLGTARILCGRALQGYFSVGHCRDTLRLGTSVKHCRETHWLSAAVRRCRDTCWLGTAGIPCSRGLQGYFAVGHIR